MLSHTDLKKGTYFILDGEPHEVLEATPLFKGRGSSVQQTRIRNAKTGTVLQKSFHAGETFEEADITKVRVRFVYARRGTYVFAREDDPSRRFELSQEQLGDQARFLVANALLDGLVLDEQVINVSLPIKVRLRVTEAPPGVQGDRSQGGTKTVTLESGAEVQAPLFVEEGDILEVNTETGAYVRRVQE